MAATDEQLMTSSTESRQQRAFAANELVACKSCSRTNPPTRARCLYCGAALETAAEVATVASANKVHETESADVFHVVVISAGGEGHEQTGEIARIVNLAPAELNLLLNARCAPLFSTDSAQSAQDIADKLRAAGIESAAITDVHLKIGTSPKQIAALTIDDHALTATIRRNGERASVPWTELALIVAGRLYFTTAEIEQKRGKSKHVLDERQLTTDEAVLDIYVRGDDCGWRISAGSFDFSCLGSRKGITAFENFASLVDMLRSRAGDAVFDDRYVKLRLALNKVWPVAPQAKTTERRRTATREINATSTLTDNELQFTRYSRMLRYFQTRRSEDDARQP